MSRNRTPEQTALYFVRYHLGKHAFAPLTGTDWRAWRAFVHLLELYGVSRGRGAIEALRACYACTLRSYGAQGDVAAVFLQTIPAMLDWSDTRTLWPLIAPASKLAPHAFDRNEYKAAIKRQRAKRVAAANASTDTPS
jgi:hypothetical protein